MAAVVASPDPAPPPSPSVAAVERLPALGGAELVRARGRAPAGAAPLLVAGELRIESLPEPRLGHDATAWSATFVVPAEAAREPAWLEWPGGARVAVAAAAPVAGLVRLDERRSARALPPPAWEAHRAALERELARATEVAAAAREETAARIAEHAAELRVMGEQAAARVTRSEQVAAAARMRLSGAVEAAAQAEARLRAEAIAREALTAQLDRLAAELAAARADAAAARRVREAEASSLAAVTAGLEAERAAHAVTRGTVSRLIEELAAARRERPASPPPAADRAASPPPPAADRAASPPVTADLRRLAAAQSAAAAAAHRPSPEAGRLVADLDAAATALRRDAAGPPRRLRDALVSLAREDPRAAGELLVQLLPAQAAVIDAALSYDLVIRGVGTYAVTLDGGTARVVALPGPRPRGQAELALTADPLSLAEWLAGADVRVGRYRGRVRRRGWRRALAPLRALPASTLSVTEAARAGARLQPGLVYRALAHAIDPDWTKGHSFVIAQALPDQTVYLAARDGAGLAVSAAPPARPPDATVTLTREAFDRLLRGEPPLPGARPSIRGDRAAVETLRTWAERARS